jgi:hypothetical protein
MIEALQVPLIVWVLMAGFGTGGASFLRAWTAHKVAMHHLTRGQTLLQHQRVSLFARLLKLLKDHEPR